MSEDKSIVAESFLCPNEFSNYLVGSNLCNAFVVGEIGASDDFFLVGAPATGVDAYPVLTGNFLDSEGNPLFKIVRNILVVNPRNCSKILGDQIGYEIHDGQGHPVLKVESRYHTESGLGQYVTTIHGTFYGKGGRKIATATGEQLEFLDGTKLAMGFMGGGIAMMMNYSAEEAEIAKLAVASAGAIYQIVRGEIEGTPAQPFELDGKVLIDATVKGEVICSSGNFAVRGKTSLGRCRVSFNGPASRIFKLAQVILWFECSVLRRSAARQIGSGVPPFS
jgi:hypothetical protein